MMKPSQISKHYLAEPPVLTSPEAGKTLFVYLAISNVSVSANLFKEDENKKQRPIFFVRKSLTDAKTLPRKYLVGKGGLVHYTWSRSE